MTDIADVTYVHLSTENDEYLYKGGICDITEHTIVVRDNSSSSILFFSRDGKPKSRFNRKGEGPEEYSPFVGNQRMIIYDEDADEVYVYASSKSIMVYSIGRYQLMSDYTYVNRLEREAIVPQKHYGRDKLTGEIFTPKITLPDYKGAYFSDLACHVVGDKILAFNYLNLYALKQAYNDNKLSGKLKELVATLNENEDNDVCVFATFK